MAQEDPIQIYQDWLDIVSGALLAEDIETISAHVALPYLHRSIDTRIVVETRHDLDSGFRTFARALRALGVNQFIRLVTSAEFLSTEYLQGHHVTHILRNATPVVPSYVNRMVLRRGPNAWKMTEVYNGFSHGSWPVKSITVPAADPTRPHGAENDARRDAAQPLALYQRFLNKLTQANVAGDFDGYVALCQFPYSWHARAEDTVVNNPDEVRPFFNMMSGLLQNNGIEEFVRIADHAEFLNGNTICGYHTARFLKDGRDAIEPVKSRMILHRVGVRWFLNSVTNAIVAIRLDGGRPETAPDLVTQIEIEERTKT